MVSMKPLQMLFYCLNAWAASVAHSVQNDVRFKVIWAILHLQGILYPGSSERVKLQKPVVGSGTFSAQTFHFCSSTEDAGRRDDC